MTFLIVVAVLAFAFLVTRPLSSSPRCMDLDPPHPLPDLRWTYGPTDTTQTAATAPYDARLGARARRRLKRATGALALAALACSPGPTAPCSGGHPRPAPCYWMDATPRPAR